MSPTVIVKMNLGCFGTFFMKIEYPSTTNSVVLQEITKPITITKKLWKDRKDNQDKINSATLQDKTFYQFWLFLELD